MTIHFKPCLISEIHFFFLINTCLSLSNHTVILFFDLRTFGEKRAQSEKKNAAWPQEPEFWSQHHIKKPFLALYTLVALMWGAEAGALLWLAGCQTRSRFRERPWLERHKVDNEWESREGASTSPPLAFTSTLLGAHNHIHGCTSPLQKNGAREMAQCLWGTGWGSTGPWFNPQHPH